MDEGFILRCYRTSAWVLGLVILALLSLGWARQAWSVAAGTALALGVLRFFEWIVRGVAVPGRQAPAWLMAKVTVLKLPVLAGVLYFVVNSGWFSTAAFAGGVVLVQAVIGLKALGLYLIQREEDRERLMTGLRSRPGGQLQERK